MKNMSAIFLIVVTAAAITVPTRVGTKAQDNIVTFVIDSTSSILADDQKFLSQFNTFSHGEAVSKLIGAEVRGIFNVDDSEGNIDKNKYYDALFYILNQIKKLGREKKMVVNMSFGSRMPTEREYLIIRELYRNGVIMIAAAGNEGTESCLYPAAYDEVISVGACEKSVIADYSNNCKDIDIVAKGKYTETRTWSIFLEQSTERLTLHGTSFSTPRVTSIVVKMLEQRPGLNKGEIVDILQRTSIEIQHSKCKGGRVNRLKALAEISDKYRRLYRIRNWSLIAIATLSTIMIGGLLGFLLLIFVLLPVLMPLFWLFLPGVWLHIKKREIQKVMHRKEKSDKGIKFIVKCFIAQDYKLKQIARKALLEICGASILDCRRVRSSLKSTYNYVKVNKSANKKTSIESLLAEISLKFFSSTSIPDFLIKDTLTEPDLGGDIHCCS